MLREWTHCNMKDSGFGHLICMFSLLILLRRGKDQKPSKCFVSLLPEIWLRTSLGYERLLLKAYHLPSYLLP